MPPKRLKLADASVKHFGDNIIKDKRLNRLVLKVLLNDEAVRPHFAMSAFSQLFGANTRVISVSRQTVAMEMTSST